VLAVGDAGPLYAAADADDEDHEMCVAALARGDLRLVVPALVIAEATYFVARRLGPAAESKFLRGLGTLDVEGPVPDDFDGIAKLVNQYADLPLDGTDASVIALAERIGAPAIITLDRRHFAAVKPRHRQTFELLPPSEPDITATAAAHQAVSLALARSPGQAEAKQRCCADEHADRRRAAEAAGATGQRPRT
jgi:predicted nucleic acid-binding protein